MVPMTINQPSSVWDLKYDEIVIPRSLSQLGLLRVIIGISGKIQLGKTGYINL